MNTLQKNVIEQLGYDEFDEECNATLQDVAQYGADSGFGQFVYYSDTCQFFDNNRSAILQSVSDLAGELGESPSTMVQNFGCLNGDYNREVDQVLMGIECDEDVQVKNALAWFALEETARELINE